MNRDSFSSRLGFILVSAGCSIGLGNVWRFPYITGKYGGASFVLIYLFFLLALGLPIIVAEFAVGRASAKSAARSFESLEPAGTKWHLGKYPIIAGNIILMMFYAPISSWMLYYLYKMATGAFVGLDAKGVGGVFGTMLGDPVTMTGCMALTVILCAGVCYLGVRAGVERITKWMMAALFGLMIVLAINSSLLPGADAGLQYYLTPDFSKLRAYDLTEVIFAAMGQAFFTLSCGIGALAIFGSYIGKEHSLTGEAVWITFLDTVVALIAGFIIFPACFSYGVDPSSGPVLIFIALPNIFASMPLGQLWGSLFFLFMSFAAMSTIIAVFENIIACFCELLHKERDAIIRGGVPIMILLAIPCILGFNVWSGFTPLGPGSGVLDLEDFIVSNNILPLGSLFYLLFCTTRYGWGWNAFFKEANTGNGQTLPAWTRGYLTYCLPAIVLIIFFNGYYTLFFK